MALHGIEGAFILNADMYFSVSFNFSILCFSIIDLILVIYLLSNITDIFFYFSENHNSMWSKSLVEFFMMNQIYNISKENQYGF